MVEPRIPDPPPLDSYEPEEQDALVRWANEVNGVLKALDERLDELDKRTGDGFDKVIKVMEQHQSLHELAARSVKMTDERVDACADKLESLVKAMKKGMG